MFRRFHQILLVVSMLCLSWLMMMFVHESGHVLGAFCSGGRVRQVVWHPAVISRTDVQPNPHPLVEVWAGPVIGSLVPLLVAGGASLVRARAAYLFWVVAGFCLIANGGYIGVGAFQPVGDACELIAGGTPKWVMAAFGTVGVVVGFWIWDRVSPKLGFGSSPVSINKKHAYVCAILAVIVTATGIAFGNRGT